MKHFATSLFARLRLLYDQNPVRAIAVVTAAVIALGAAFDVVLDGVETGQVVAVVLLIVFGGEVAKRKVTPV